MAQAFVSSAIFSLLALSPLADAPESAAPPRAVVDGTVKIQAARKQEPDAARFTAFGDRVETPDRLLVFLHLRTAPGAALLASLRSLGVDLGERVAYVPPVGRHPHGYLIADVPSASLDAISRLPEIARIRSGERRFDPHWNDVAGASGPLGINADAVQSLGFDGSGIRVAILDSSLDVSHPDFPTPIAVKDYSAFPSLDDDVASQVSGHGTHVTGSVLGRGTASGGLYEGQAPAADLVFLKIGNDSNASATSAAMAAAIVAAVDVYDADVVTASYGGFGTFNDGSEEIEQAADYAFSEGALVFFSAGNSAALAIHFSGTLDPGATSPFIQVNVGNSGGSTLYFTLVWADGIGTTDDLDLRFYDGTQTEITSGIVLVEHPESPRGTECDEAYYNVPVTGPSTYYVRVVNNSASTRFYHAFSFGFRVTFASPDSSYTVGIPSIADEAISVAAYCTRDSFVNWCGTSSGFGQSLGNVASWSSRGPRIGDDGDKPSLAAPGTAVISALDSDAPYSSSLWIADDGVNDCDGPAQYCALQGTSMACPTAAGAAALLLSAYPALRGEPAAMRDLLQRTSDNAGAWANSDGYGYMDVLDAYNDAVIVAELDAADFPVTQVAPAPIVVRADVSVEGVRVASGLLAGDFGAIIGGEAATVTDASFDGGLLQWELTILPPSLAVGTHDVALDAVVGGRTTPADVVIDGYVVREPVAVLSVTPDDGPTSGGTAITIGGTGFTTTPDTTLTIGGVSVGGFMVVNETTLTATAPAHALGAADVVISNTYGTDTLTGGFTYFEPVAVVSVAPDSGPIVGGTPITITGEGFVTGSSVTVGGVAATGVVIVNSTTLTANTPEGSVGAADVAVSNENGSDTLTGGFTYFEPVTVVSVAPDSGPTVGGTAITITGEGFVTGSSVTVGGVAATGVVIVNSSTLTANTPEGSAGAADVLVSNENGSDTLTGGFTYFVPVSIATIDPACGGADGGTPVTITGAGFLAGSTTVSIGGSPATNVVVVNGNTITADSPAGAAGLADVDVENENGSASLPLGFEYLGSEVTCLYGTVNAGAGPVTDVLRVNGGVGDAKTRVATLAIGEPFTLTMDAPPADAIAPFVLYVHLGEPTPSTSRTQPHGIGCTAFPTPLQPLAVPQPYAIFNNIGKTGKLGVPDYPSNPAPSTIIDKQDGIGRALVITVQALIADSGSAGTKPGSVTNGIVIRVE